MGETIIRTIFFYLFVTFAYRIMGKREVGQLGIIDLIVSIMIAELVALSIEKTNQSVLLTLVPITVLVLIEILFGFLMVKSRIFNKIFAGKPSMIISEGKIVYKNLVSQRYSIDDLLLQLRKKGISSIEEVEYAFLEPNGDLSIFKYKPFKIKSSLPLPIVVDGIIQVDNLKYINKSSKWLYALLDKYNLELTNVFYAIYNTNHVYIIKKN